MNPSFLNLFIGATDNKDRCLDFLIDKLTEIHGWHALRYLSLPEVNVSKCNFLSKVLGRSEIFFRSKCKVLRPIRFYIEVKESI